MTYRYPLHVNLSLSVPSCHLCSRRLPQCRQFIRHVYFPSLAPLPRNLVGFVGVVPLEIHVLSFQCLQRCWRNVIRSPTRKPFVAHKSNRNGDEGALLAECWHISHQLDSEDIRVDGELLLAPYLDVAIYGSCVEKGSRDDSPST